MFLIVIIEKNVYKYIKSNEKLHHKYNSEQSLKKIQVCVKNILKITDLKHLEQGVFLQKN